MSWSWSWLIVMSWAWPSKVTSCWSFFNLRLIITLSLESHLLKNIINIKIIIEVRMKRPLYRFRRPDWEGWSSSCNVHSKPPNIITIIVIKICHPIYMCDVQLIMKLPWTQWRWRHRCNVHTGPPWRPLRFQMYQMRLYTCVCGIKITYMVYIAHITYLSHIL